MVGRRAGVDPRAVGSGNPGATNVARSLGWRAGLFTLAGDVAKGAFAPLLCEALGLDVAVATYAGIAAVLGHLFPIFAHFQGGKGVATAFGVILALAPPVAVAAVAVFAVTANATRYVSVGSMSAAAVLPFALYLFDSPWEVVRMGIVIGAAILWRHRENLARLMQHTEPTF